MPIPEYATNKLVQVVDRLSHDIILGGGDWETVEYFQNMLETKGIRFSLAHIAVEIRKENPDWIKIVKTIEDLDEERGVEFLTKIATTASLQQDAAEMLQIPLEEEGELNKFIESMKKEYEKDESLYNVMVALLDAYKEGTEQEILEDKPFARSYVVQKLKKWLKKSLETLGAVPMPKALRKRKRDTTQETRGQLQDLRRARGQLRGNVVDPLQEAREVGKLARGAQLYDKKASATRLEFSQDEDEVDDPEEARGTRQSSEQPWGWDPDAAESSAAEEAHGTHQLSDMPERMAPAARERSPARYVKSPGSGPKRRWTKEQKNAFIAALGDYGTGNWCGMRDSEQYRDYWQGKTNVQLKDLYRTMKQRGELPQKLF